MQLTPFHLAIQVRDIDEAREFYGRKLGLPEGRSSDQWIDFNLFGHQLVIDAVPGHEDLVRPLLHHPALVQHQNAVGLDHAG